MPERRLRRESGRSGVPEEQLCFRRSRRRGQRCRHFPLQQRHRWRPPISRPARHAAGGRSRWEERPPTRECPSTGGTYGHPVVGTPAAAVPVARPPQEVQRMPRLSRTQASSRPAQRCRTHLVRSFPRNRDPGRRVHEIKALAEYLGHSGPCLTLRVYANLMPSSQERTRKAIAYTYDAFGLKA